MPEIMRFGPGKASDNTGAGGVTWVDIDIAVDADRAWLMAWQEINEQTRQALLEPVHFNHYEQVPDGTLLSVRTLHPGQTEDVADLADLKLLIGSTRAVTVRSGALLAVDELRQRLLSDRTLVTAVDLLGFLVSAMTNRMEAVIYELTQDIDDIEDALLDGGSVPPPQMLSQLRRRIFRTRRQVNGTQQVLAPMTTDPAIALDADDRETLNRASNHVTRYLGSLDECRARVQMLEDQIEAQRSDTMTRSNLNLSIVATVFLPLSFITGLLGMNVGGIPEEHNPLGFWMVTGVSIIISVVAWRWLRRQTFDRYLLQASIGNKAPEPSARARLIDDAGSTPAVKAITGELSNHLDPLLDNELRGQAKSSRTKAGTHRTVSRSKLVGVHVFALLLALVLFLFHVVIIIDVAGELIRREAWLLAQFGHYAGKVSLLGCFFVLFLAHILEAGAWGLFLRGARLLPSVTDGIYFTAVAITTLGYGDVLLKYPWRHLGTLIAITGVLMFGCSTAFLFLVLQEVWKLHI
jgi:zinc transporter